MRASLRGSTPPAAALFAAITLLAACDKSETAAADGAVATDAMASVAPQVVDVSAGDFYYTMPDTLSAGATTFRLITTGQELHHMTLVKLEDGKTLEDLMTAIKSGPPPAWAQFVGGPNPPTPMAATAEVTVDLTPGSYAAVCFVPSPDGVEHVAKGMSKTFVVTPSATPALMPLATDTMTLSDYDFSMGHPLTAGEHTVLVQNSAAQVHEVFVAKLAPGATPEQLVAWIMKPDGPPPGEAMGGVASLQTGVDNIMHLNLPAGDYALICFVPDAGDGKPHLEHGMIKQITVL
jgi:hypothetical protein